MSAFAPSIDNARRAGHPATVAPYPDGAAGIQLSLEKVAEKIREGRLDAAVRGWTGDVLIAAGRPHGIKEQAQAILDAFRQATVYVPDPTGAEFIASAAATLCLRPGLCVRARDCDDSVVAVGSALMSVGIPVVVIKQNFGPEHQEHVLIEFQDEAGQWIPMDPSTTSSPVGFSHNAVEEQRIDPMDVVGSTGTSGAEIVTLGRPPTLGDAPYCCSDCAQGSSCACDASANEPRGWAYLGAPPEVGLARQVQFHQGRWWEHRYGQLYYYENGAWRMFPTGPIDIAFPTGPIHDVRGARRQAIFEGASGVAGAGIAGDCKDMRTLESLMAQGYRDAAKRGEPYTGMGGVLPAGTWTPQPDMQATNGLRYVLIFGAAGKPQGLPLWLVAAFALWPLGGAAPAILARAVNFGGPKAPMTEDDVRTFLSPDWLVESAALDITDAQGNTSWVVQAVARHDQKLNTTQTITYTMLYRQGTPVVGPPQVVPPSPPTPGATPSGTSFATVAAVALGVGVAGGVGYALWRHSKGKKHRG